MKVEIHQNLGDLETLSEPWRELSQRALEPNIFYTPCFLLPALRYLANNPIETLVVSEGSTLVGLVPVVPRLRVLGAGHRKAWRHEQCFLDIPLLDRECGDEVLISILSFLKERSPLGGSLQMDHLLNSPAVSQAFSLASSKLPAKYFVRDVYSRLAFYPLETRDAYFASISRHRKKDIKTKHKKLRELGEVEVRFRHPHEPLEWWVNTFLDMEKKGWKGKVSSALQSSISEEQFFREMTKRADEQEALLFHALFLNDKPIAISCDLISGTTQFAYKTTFDEDFKDFSPGFLLSVERFLYVTENLPQVKMIDSCMAPNETHRAGIWLGECPIANYTLSTNACLNSVLGTRSLLRGVSSALRS